MNNREVGFILVVLAILWC